MISIVMPTYNQSKYIAEAIDSILAQTYTDFELIVVDDGSTDDTTAIVRKYEDPRVKYMFQPNHGTGTALNTGFSLATGEYETWWASDNKMYPNCLEQLVKYLNKNCNIDYVYSHIDYADMEADGLTVMRVRPLSRILDQTWNKDRFQTHYFLGCCWLWRRPLRLKCGDGKFQKEPCEDFDMALRMTEADGEFAFLNETLGWYRQHSENITHKLVSHQFYKDVLEKAKNRRMPKKEVNFNFDKMKIAIINLEFDCAGVGWNLKEAINDYTPHKCKHVAKKTFHFAPHTDANLNNLKPIIEWADVLHFNQWIWTHNPSKPDPFQWTPFMDKPIMDFDKYFKTRQVIFHYHAGEVLAEPSYWIKECNRVGAQIFCCAPTTELVVPGAKWMPNVLDITKFKPVEFEADGGTPAADRIRTYSAHGESDDRKNISIYKRFMAQTKRCGFSIPYDIIWGLTKEDSYKAREKYHVAIESLIEGYIGMVGWEAMAMGQVVIARIGEYTMKRYTELGEGTPPPIQTAESPQCVTRLLRDMAAAPPATKRIMKDSRTWMEKYYNPKRIVEMYINAYKGGNKSCGVQII